jgi:hypothetical protein
MKRFEIEPHAQRGNMVVIVNEDAEATSFGIYGDDELIDEGFRTRREAEIALGEYLLQAF